MKSWLGFSCFLLLCLSTVAKSQATLSVPGQYPDLESAILAAQSGDTINLALGNYSIANYCQIQGKDLHIKGNGSTLAKQNANSVRAIFEIGSGTTTATIIEGFSFDGVTSDDGSAIFRITQGAATIRDCSFKNCAAAPTSLFIHPQPPSSILNGGVGTIDQGQLILENCLFEDNKASQGGQGWVGVGVTNALAQGGGWGGALYFKNSTATIKACTFRRNNAGQGGSGTNSIFSMGDYYDGGRGGSGGALGALLSHLSIESCRFENNRSGYRGDPSIRPLTGQWGALGASGHGGAIATIDGTLKIDQCVFERNNGGSLGTQLKGARGGAIFTTSHLRCENSVFQLNWIAFGQGGAIFAQNVNGDGQGNTVGVFSQCIFDSNAASPHETERGSALSLLNSQLLLEHCALRDNFPNNQLGGVLTLTSSTLKVANSIWRPGDLGTFATASNNLTIEHSNVEGFLGGVGNIDADPKWRDAPKLDYHLQVDSPCIDAAGASITASQADIEGEPRIWNGQADMGPDEFYGVGLAGRGTTTDPNSGNTEDTLFIDQSAGDTPARLKRVALGAGYLIELRNPSFNTTPAHNAIFGFVGVPTLADQYSFAYLSAPLAFPPQIVQPGNPQLFTLTSSFAPNSGLAAGTFSSWAILAPAFNQPITYTLQGFVLNDAFDFMITNAVVVEVK